MMYTQITKKLTRLENELLGLRKALWFHCLPARLEDRRTMLQKTGGILKSKIKGNLVAWQKRARAEWR